MHRGVTSIIAPGTTPEINWPKRAMGMLRAASSTSQNCHAPHSTLRSTPQWPARRLSQKGRLCRPQSIPSQAQASTMTQGNRVNSSVPTTGMATE